MKYSATIFKAREDGHEFYVVRSRCIRGCVAQGDTLEEALSLFNELEEECIETAHEYNIPIKEEVVDYDKRITEV